jgi:hypothetical protein
MSLRPFNVKQNKRHTSFIQNEATLTIDGPGFDKGKTYRFMPDIVTVGGYDKSDKITKIGFTRMFTNSGQETITVSLEIDLLSSGTLELDPPKEGPAAHAGISYQKLSSDETQTIDISMLSEEGEATIDVYSAEFVKGSFNGTFENPEKKQYRVQCSFKIQKVK